MLSIQQFTNVSTYELEEVMDCNKNQNRRNCFKKELKKCDLLYSEKRYVKNNRYFYCKQSAFMRFKSEKYQDDAPNDNFEFCQHTFRPWNTEMFTQEEIAGWQWYEPEKSIFGDLMRQCYQNNRNRMKEFCDDTAKYQFRGPMSKRNVYDCYKKYRVPKRASISRQVACEEKQYTPEFAEQQPFTPPNPEDLQLKEGQTIEEAMAEAIEIAKKNAEQLKPTKTVVDLKFECLRSKGEDVSDYCYQKVLKDGWTHEQYIECSKNDEIKLFKEGDAFAQKLSTQDFAVLNYPDNYFNNSNYRIYLEQIYNKYGLDKPMECALQLEYFYQLGKTN